MDPRKLYFLMGLGGALLIAVLLMAATGAAQEPTLLPESPVEQAPAADSPPQPLSGTCENDSSACQEQPALQGDGAGGTDVDRAQGEPVPLGGLGLPQRLPQDGGSAGYSPDAQSGGSAEEQVSPTNDR